VQSAFVVVALSLLRLRIFSAYLRRLSDHLPRLVACSHTELCKWTEINVAIIHTLYFPFTTALAVLDLGPDFTPPLSPST
jgi:hypothetical protein